MDKVTGFDIPVVNMNRAKEFYEDIFGWQIVAYKDDYYHIETVKTDKKKVPKEKGSINGAMFKKKSKNDKPLLVIEVPSIDEYLEKVKENRGKVITGKKIAGKCGYWAEIMDTEGNIFELWEVKK